MAKITPTPPRYDEVYEKGMAWLDSLARLPAPFCPRCQRPMKLIELVGGAERWACIQRLPYSFEFCGREEWR